MCECIVEDCAKKVHVGCYESLVLSKHQVPHLVDPTNGQKVCVCSKTCYSKTKKAMIDQPSCVPWNRDGKSGPNDSTTSEKVLLDWLLTEGNYNRCRGKNNNGTSKVKYCQEISRRIEQAECRVKRSAEQVQQKISHLETKFTEAHDWASNTGQGVLERDGQASFDDAVRQRCPYYFELLPIMGDRGKARPRVTTDTLEATLTENDDGNLSGLSDDDEDLAPSSRSVAGSSIGRSSQSRRQVTNTKRSPPTGTDSAKKRRSRLVDDDSTMLRTLMDEKSKYKATYLEEKIRHNKQMEDLESRKIQWQEKGERLDYMRKLLSFKREMEEAGHSRNEIIAMAPDTKQLYDAEQE